jgi:hypothetical protein
MNKLKLQQLTILPIMFALIVGWLFGGIYAFKGEIPWLDRLPFIVLVIIWFGAGFGVCYMAPLLRFIIDAVYRHPSEDNERHPSEDSEYVGAPSATDETPYQYSSSVGENKKAETSSAQEDPERNRPAFSIEALELAKMEQAAIEYATVKNPDPMERAERATIAPDEPCHRYYLKIHRNGVSPLYKIGISRDTERRVRDLTNGSGLRIEILAVDKLPREAAFVTEQALHAKYREHRYDGPKIFGSAGGDGELFVGDVLQLDSL